MLVNQGSIPIIQLNYVLNRTTILHQDDNIHKHSPLIIKRPHMLKSQFGLRVLQCQAHYPK
jgi:hypothetical protein